jgi:preprotein translocase subunit SecG
MATFLLIIHLIVCLFLITIVLIQGGKGAELGAAFGGSSQTLFGARGAATFFSKLTTGAAIVFMLTSLTLALVTSKSSSVIKKVPAATEQRQIPQGTTPGPIQGSPAPQAPAAPGAPAK